MRLRWWRKDILYQKSVYLVDYTENYWSFKRLNWLLISEISTLNYLFRIKSSLKKKEMQKIWLHLYSSCHSLGWYYWIYLINMSIEVRCMKASFLLYLFWQGFLSQRNLISLKMKRFVNYFFFWFQKR